MVPSILRITRTISPVAIALAGIVVSLPTVAAAQAVETIPEQPTETVALPSTTSTTIVSPSSEAPVEPAPSTTVPDPTTTEVSPTESSTATTTIETTTTTDVASSEQESSGGYSSQPRFVADSVDPAKVGKARQRLTQANRQLAETAELIEVREKSLESVNSQVDELAGETSELINQSADLRNGVHNMAVANFRNPSLGYPKPEIEEPSDAMVYRRLLAFVASRNDEMADQFDRLNGQLTDDERELVAETSRLSGERDQAQILYDQRVSVVEQAEIELATYEAAGEFFVPNAVFPLAQPYPLPLINSYGFDRARGTADSHWHEGIDIFGPRGTELYAAEPGVITNVGSGRLGGLVISLMGDSGTRWYYAHLDGFALGLAEGQVVQAGDVVGYLGDSGNARGTDPHLHLEIHPPDLRVVNPYPQLNVLAQRDLLESEQNPADSATTGRNVSIS